MISRSLALFPLVLFLFTAVAAHSYSNNKKSYSDIPHPLQFNLEVKSLIKAAKESFPPNGIIITGSSSVRMWHPRIQKDFHPLPVMGMGFGGSTYNDLLYYSDQLITQFKPSAVVIYEGDNDIAHGASNAEIIETMTKLTQKLLGANPNLDIYIVSIKPSFARWKLWPMMEAANKQLKEICDKNARLHYIDASNPLLENGKLIDNIYLLDGLHLNTSGYDIWGKAIVDAVKTRELKQASEP